MRTSSCCWTLLAGIVGLHAVGCSDDNPAAPGTSVNADASAGTDGSGLPDAQDGGIQDGPAGESAGPVKLKGSVQKGPLVLGSNVQVSMLDASGNPTGKVFLSVTLNDMGDFELTVPEPGTAELLGTGFYLNELTGALSGASITLHALANIQTSGSQMTYVNLLTHMSQRRASNLIVGGTPFADGIQQAEAELRSALGILFPASTAGPATQMNILGGDSPDNEYLLAVSCVFDQAASLAGSSADAKLQELVNMVSLDLEPDGQLQLDLVKKVVDAEKALDPAKCTDNFQKWLTEKGSGVAPPDIEKVIDTDKDGIPNGADPDDDNDGSPDATDCAPLDPKNQVALVGAEGSSEECVPDDEDDDNDGVLDTEDCFPLDPKGTIVGEVGKINGVGSMSGVFVKDGLAYIGKGGLGGLLVFDVADPRAPIKLGELSEVFANDIVVSGNYAYAMYKSISVVDVSIPASPVKKGESSITTLGSMAIAGQYAYVAPLTGMGGPLSIFDLSDPESPSQVGTLGASSTTGGVAVEGSHAYAPANGPNGQALLVIDVSSPSQPKQVGSVDLKQGLFTDVLIEGNTAYLGGEKGGVQVVDISNPTTPLARGYVWTEGVPAQTGVRHLAKKDQFILQSNRMNGVNIVDVSDPDSPKSAGVFMPSSTAVVVPSAGIHLSGDLIYLATMEGVRILKVGCL